MGNETPESREELLRHLEDLTGRSFRTRDDVRQYVGESKARGDSMVTGMATVWRTVKQTALLALLVLAFVQYYLIDVLKEMVSISGVTVFVPVKLRDLRSTLEALSSLLV
jgi:hypothetical protein